MSTEDKLKEYILNRYKSLREFAQIINMSPSTFDSILKRGIDNSSITNIIKICKELKISVDELADGNIVPKQVNPIVTESTVEVTEILADVKNVLTNRDGLTIDGDPANKDSIDSIVQAMTIGEEMAKKKK